MFGALYEWRLRLQKEAYDICTKRPKRKRMGGRNRSPSVAERGDVLKGVTRRVVIVKVPDPRIFEEAIFVVSEEFMNSGGVSAAELLREANMAAGSYIEMTLGRPPPRGDVRWLRAAAYSAAVCAAAAIILIALNYFAVL